MTRQPGIRRLRKPLVFALLLSALLLLSWYVRSNVSLQQLVNQEIQIRALIADRPWCSFLAGFAIYQALAFVPGTGGKAIVWGWLFGFWPALLIVSVGLTIAAMAIFLMSRYLFQDAVERRFGNYLGVMHKHLEKEGAYYLLTLRMLHFPFSIVNPVSGASRIPAWTFLWTTVVGLMPSNVIWIFVGISLPSLQELAAAGPTALISLPLALALAGLGALPILVRLLLRYFVAPQELSRKDHP